MKTTPLFEAARMLNLGPKKLFAALRQRNVLTKQNLPFRQYVEQGLFTTELKEYKHPKLGMKLYAQTHVTDQGLKWLAEEFDIEITKANAQQKTGTNA